MRIRGKKSLGTAITIAIVIAIAIAFLFFAFFHPFPPSCVPPLSYAAQRRGSACPSLPPSFIVVGGGAAAFALVSVLRGREGGGGGGEGHVLRLRRRQRSPFPPMSRRTDGRTDGRPFPSEARSRSLARFHVDVRV